MRKTIVFLFLCLLLMITTGCSIKKVHEMSDQEKFAKEFNISKKNPFIYANIDTILDILENGTGLIFFANSDYEGSLKAATYITEVAKKEEIHNIYYYNPKKLKEKNPRKYQKLVKYLGSCLEKRAFFLPDLYSIKEGKIINHSRIFSKEEELSEEYLSKKRLNNIKSKYQNVLTYQECSNCC